MTYTDTMGRRDYDRDYGYGRFPDDLDRLSNLDDWEIVEGEPDPRGYTLVGTNGEEIGTIKDLLASPSTQKAYFAIVDSGGWFENRQFAVPLAHVRFNEDEERAYGPFTRAQFESAPQYREGDRDFAGWYSYWSGYAPTAAREGYAERTEDMAAATAATGAVAEAPAGEVRVPVMEETAEVRKERREAGHVTLRKRVDVETRHISEPVTRTRVVAETREVPAGQQYAHDADVTTLREGEELRVPVVEEELTVEKTPRVTREVVVRAEPVTEQVERDVELRRERVEVDREGDVDVEDVEEAPLHRRP